MPLYDLAGKAPTLPADGSAWVAPSADLIGDVMLGEGASVWWGAVVRADNTPIMIGAGSNVQDHAVLHSDPGSPCTVGTQVTIGHRAILHGCTVGNRVLIGMGAIILNGAVIPDDCLVGAGALVPEGRTFAPVSLILGVPAVARRALTVEQIAAIVVSAEGYRGNARRYADGLRRID